MSNTKNTRPFEMLNLGGGGSTISITQTNEKATILIKKIRI